MSRYRIGLAGAALFGGLVLAVGLSASGQAVKGKSRPAATKHLMVGVVKLHSGNLEKALNEGPKDDAGWDAAAAYAGCLNEVSYALMDDGRCPDKVWEGAAMKLREGSAAALDAIQKRNLDGAKAGVQALKAACGACHKAHKPKK